MDEFQPLAKACQLHWPRDIVVPVRKGEKHPIHPHSGGRWTWAKLSKFLFSIRADGENDKAFDACLLLNDLCVIDVDTLELAEELERTFPLLASVPRVATKRGRHYWFQRSTDADLRGYYDGAAQRVKGIDFKSKYQNGTSGVILVAPSSDKQWMDQRCTILQPDKVVPIPLEILDHVAVPRHHVVRRRFLYADRDEAVEDELCLDQLAYFEPFLAQDFPEDEAIPTPCTREELVKVTDLVSEKDFDLEKIRQLTEVLKVADLLGADIEGLKHRLFHGRTVWRADLETAWPEMARAMLGGAAIRPVTERILYSDPSFSGHEERRLFSKGCPRFSPGQEVVSFTSSKELCEKLSESVASSTVLELLRRFPLMLAGGSALGAVASHESKIHPGSDYDLFVLGMDEEEADVMMTELMATTFASGWTKTQTRCAFTFVHDESALGNHIATIQIIVQLYREPKDVFDSFDMSPCMVGIVYDKTDEEFRVLAAEQWLVAMRSMTFAVNLDRWSSSAMVRTVKYARKGFNVVLPGVRRSFVKVDRPLPGVASLLYLEDQSFGIHPANRMVSMHRLYNAMNRVAGLPSRKMPANSYGDYVKSAGLFSYIIRSAVRNAVTFGREWVTRIFGERVAGTKKLRQNNEEWMCMWFKYDPRKPIMVGAESPRTWLLHQDRAGFELYMTHELFRKNEVLDRAALDEVWPCIEKNALAPLVAKKLDAYISNHVQKLVAATRSNTLTFGELDLAAKAAVHGFLDAHETLHGWNNYAVLLKDLFGIDGIVQMVTDIGSGKLVKAGFFKNVIRSILINNKALDPARLLELTGKSLDISEKDGLHVGIRMLREELRKLPPKRCVFARIKPWK
jgi:hypothetical protein